MSRGSGPALVPQKADRLLEQKFSNDCSAGTQENFAENYTRDKSAASQHKNAIAVLDNQR